MGGSHSTNINEGKNFELSSSDQILVFQSAVDRFTCEFSLAHVEMYDIQLTIGL
jgi:hypothetical protein